VILPDGSEATAPLTVTAAAGDPGGSGGAGDGLATTGAGDGLATTGADPTAFAVIAALLLMLGAGLVVARRRIKLDR
jgi:LPXTG-motif cell wall-anchored protein